MQKVQEYNPFTSNFVTQENLTDATAGSGAGLAASSGASLTLIKTVTSTGATTVDLEDTFTGYDTYMLVANNLKLSSSASTIVCRFKIGGSYITATTYRYHKMLPTSAASAYSGNTGSGNDRIEVCSSVGINAADSAAFVMHIYDPSITTTSKKISWTGTEFNSTTLTVGFGSGGTTTTGALEGIRFFSNAGANLVSGTFRLYGIKNS